MTNRLMYGLCYKADTEINVISIKYKEYGLNKRIKY